jgi:hypothetical protein
MPWANLLPLACLLLASSAATVDNLFGMLHNLTDPACLQRHVQCSSLAAIHADATTLPKPNAIPGLGFIQALQVFVPSKAASHSSYSIATGPNATGPNTVLVSVDIPTGMISAIFALPFVHVSTLAEGMFLHYDAAARELLVVGEMDTPPPSLPRANAGDHIVFRVNPSTGTMVAVGFFGGGDSIANVGAFDATTGILWAQCKYDNGRTYSLLGMDTHSGIVTHNVSDPYMAGGMACSDNGRCFLIGITRKDVRPGASFERVLAELSCDISELSGNLSCTISSTPLLRLPNVCIMLGGLMAVETKTQIIYGVLQNSSTTSPCSGGGGMIGGDAAAADLVVWHREGIPAAVQDVVADTGFKLLSIDFSSKVPAVVSEPVLCTNIMLCPISITAAE